MKKKMAKGVGWAIFLVIVLGDVCLNFFLFHWLPGPLSRINFMLFGPGKMGIHGAPGFVVVLRVLIPLILFFAIVLLGNALCQKIEERLGEKKKVNNE